ncbi:tRNA glutamyl-Q(34) synthetase GluQRS [Agitococcus lubricus]|uniref:Glutamyl-Q tRNA(Asp) synthetase n=1 Tax=Agitococcus lubricus TaxID=1077255 RepID=A0A2T5IVC8_9GAMM|nr:tRNA glutamyl-Q(34) synthetase GluQRS [Agitococcus lubricus]PTQ87845.1 glutamyl-Q tRNA(Asp) synthetase [Agitococcus lubricus]
MMSSYIGRFAPSPTGALHHGSLLAALASWCAARSVNGRWLVRIEDIDTPRCQPHFAANILDTLGQYGLSWDGDVIYQSQRHHHYREALQYLQQQGDIFWCDCSRSDLNKTGYSIYQGKCRTFLTQRPHSAARLRVPDNSLIQFNDAVFGTQQDDISQTVGDFVLFRRDGLFAYQLAVVVDDALQGITEVVRGADLLDNTTRQIYLQRRLKLASVAYCHVPLVTNILGEKLSKQTGAQALSTKHPSAMLYLCLQQLGQHPPIELQYDTKETILSWAARHWSAANIPKRLTV